MTWDWNIFFIVMAVLFGLWLISLLFKSRGKGGSVIGDIAEGIGDAFD